MILRVDRLYLEKKKIYRQKFYSATSNRYIVDFKKTHALKLFLYTSSCQDVSSVYFDKHKLEAHSSRVN